MYKFFLVHLYGKRDKKRQDDGKRKQRKGKVRQGRMNREKEWRGENRKRGRERGFVMLNVISSR